MLPYLNGDAILKEYRKKSNCPVIIISAKDMVSVKVDMLKIGADDYITKPFNLDEVIARIETNLRRYNILEDEEIIIEYKDILLNGEAKSISVKGVLLDLTAREYKLLELFLLYKNKVFTKANIYERIWEEEYFGDDNVIKTHISNIRSKLKKINPKEDYIETVRGLGYRLYKINKE